MRIYETDNFQTDWLQLAGGHSACAMIPTHKPSQLTVLVTVKFSFCECVLINGFFMCESKGKRRASERKSLLIFTQSEYFGHPLYIYIYNKLSNLISVWLVRIYEYLADDVFLFCGAHCRMHCVVRICSFKVYFF